MVKSVNGGAKAKWLLGAASLALGVMGASAPAKAQEAAVDENTPQTAAEIVVPGEIKYRDRSETVAPQLEYDTDYFQRFEPLTVGDALKRVPSVAFLSDVLESDGVRLRGLDPAYTQILINGEKVPGAGSSSGAFGAGADQAFFVDRIPAELIERVEVVRSASANRSGDAMAGAINIVLRDGYTLDGGYVRAGTQYFSGDRHFGETISGVWGGELAGGRALLGFNMQDRHNPKVKQSTRYRDLVTPINLTASGGQNSGTSVTFPNLELYNTEAQTDVRDGRDMSVNFAYEVDAFGGELTLNGFFVNTKRSENEDSIEYRFGIVNNDQLFTINDNNVNIDQNSYTLNAEYEVELFGGETEFKVGWARFTTKEDEFEDETQFRRDTIPFPEADRFNGELLGLDIEDTEKTFKVEHEMEFGGLEVEFGLQTELKERITRVLFGESGNVTLAAGTQSFQARPPGVAILPFSAQPISDVKIERTRIDPFILATGAFGPLQWEAGVRFESTDFSIKDALTGAKSDKDYSFVLPSASVKWDLTETDRITASVARTVRNPSLEFLNPAYLEDEFEDVDFVGNPGLEPESAWGVDIGYERRLGRTGVMGVNVFYRDVTDLQEIAALGASPLDQNGIVGDGIDVDGLAILTPRNSGDGKVYGVELDLSTSLDFVGLENTGLFLNYSWLDSEIKDAFGKRRFNSQSDYVVNFGMIQDLPSLDAAFGFTARKQGEALSRIVSEEVTTTYGADLEVFVEKRFGQNFTLRFVGSNLLDATKDEEFNKFNNAADQTNRLFREYELESEHAGGPVYQLIGRYAF